MSSFVTGSADVISSHALSSEEVGAGSVELDVVGISLEVPKTSARLLLNGNGVLSRVRSTDSALDDFSNNHFIVLRIHFSAYSVAQMQCSIAYARLRSASTIFNVQQNNVKTYNWIVLLMFLFIIPVSDVK